MFGTLWHLPNDPLATGSGFTIANGISGSNIVGYYLDATGAAHGFLYNINTNSYTTLIDPLATGGTLASGIDGRNIVGNYHDGTGVHGFLYNTSTNAYTTLDEPLTLVATYPSGISGGNIVGSYDGIPSPSWDGFVYNTSTNAYTTLDNPLATGGTFANGIDGSNIVGSYSDGTGSHGFLYTAAPEPSTLTLLGIGGVGLVGYGWRRRKRVAA